jgi:hypothetical protein
LKYQKERTAQGLFSIDITIYPTSTRNLRHPVSVNRLAASSHQSSVDPNCHSNLSKRKEEKRREEKRIKNRRPITSGFINNHIHGCTVRCGTVVARFGALLHYRLDLVELPRTTTYSSPIYQTEAQPF